MNAWTQRIAVCLSSCLLLAGSVGAATPQTAGTSSEIPISTLKPAALPPKAPTNQTITVTDVKGRQVTLKLPISRYAISTMDVIDYLIPLLGAGAFHKLVGSGQSGGHGIEKYHTLYTPLIGPYTEHLGRISEHNAPFDLEMLLTLAPDVLIVNSAMGAHRYALEIEPQLSRAGIKLLLIDIPGKSVTTSIQDSLRLLGQVFQKEQRAAEVIGFIDAQFAPLLAAKLDQRPDGPTVYYEMNRFANTFGPTQTSASSGWGAVIATAGARNIADKVLMETAAAKSGGSTLDPEYILNQDPQFIVLSGGGGWMTPQHLAQPQSFDIVNRTGWQRLQAVKNGNVYALAHDLSRSIFGFYACQKLAAIFFPDLRATLHPEAVLDEFFRRFMLVDSSVTNWCSRLGAESCR